MFEPHYLNQHKKNQIQLRYLFLILAICFAGWQYRQYAIAFDSSLNILADISINMEILEQEINELEQQINNK